MNSLSGWVQRNCCAPERGLYMDFTLIMEIVRVNGPIQNAADRRTWRIGIQVAIGSSNNSWQWLCQRYFSWPSSLRGIALRGKGAAGGRLGVINEDDPEGTITGMPGQDRMLPPDDAEYAALVRQEDPEVLNPGLHNGWPFAVAAFKFAGGSVPQGPPDVNKWQLLHLYAGAPAFDTLALPISFSSRFEGF